MYELVVGVIEAVALAAVAGFDVYAFGKFRETERDHERYHADRENDVHQKLDKLQRSVEDDHATQNTALTHLTEDFESLRGARIAGPVEPSVSLFTSRTSDTTVDRSQQTILEPSSYSPYTVTNKTFQSDEVKAMPESSDDRYYSYSKREEASGTGTPVSGLPASYGETTNITTSSSTGEGFARLSTKVDALESELQSIRATSHDLSNLEERLASVKSELRDEFHLSLEDIRRRLETEGHPGAAPEGLTKKIKAVNQKILDVDSRIDAQLIGSVVDAKMMDEKIKDARKLVLDEVASKYSKVDVGAVREELKGDFAKMLATHSEEEQKHFVLQKSLAHVRKDLRHTDASIADVDNRIDRQLIGSVVDAKMMDEKIKDAVTAVKKDFEARLEKQAKEHTRTENRAHKKVVAAAKKAAKG